MVCVGRYAYSRRPTQMYVTTDTDARNDRR